MMQDVLGQPVPIIFCTAQAVQQLADGSFNILGIGDRLTLRFAPTGPRPEVVNVQVVTTWTGGVGQFEQVIRIFDADMRQVAESRVGFALSDVSARHFVINLIAIPATAGVYTVTVGRPDAELLRQNLTLAVEELQPPAP